MQIRIYLRMLILLVACIVITNTCIGQDKKSDVSSRQEWSGTITYLSRTTVNISGQYNQDRYKENELLNEHRMEAVFENGKGMGRQSTNSKGRRLVRERISNDNILEETTLEKLSTMGTGISELSINFNEAANTYSIEATIPEAVGTRDVIYSCKGCLGASSPVNEAYTDEATMIIVDDQKPGKDPNILIGEIREETTRDEGTTYLTHIQWSFVRGPVDVELIVTPAGYDQWLPIPGKSETEPGNNIIVNLKVQGRDGKKPRYKAMAFELELSGTSKEPGITLNAPVEIKTPASFDMSFAGEEVSNNGQSLRISSGDGINGVAQINAFDGGAYSTLAVTAILEGGIRIQGHLMKPVGPTEIFIPKRRSGSLIGQSWALQNKNPDDTVDKELIAGNTYEGDGLTAYEEYRGVISEGKFKRLSAQRKELGVSVKKGDRALFENGIALLEKAAGIDIIRLSEDELHADRQINRNSQTGHVCNQHALILEREDNDIKRTGYNDPVAGSDKTPKDSKRAVINVRYHEIYFNDQDLALKKANLSMPFTAEQNLATTIAHELAHGISINHHGNRSKEPEKYVSENTPATFHVYDYFGDKAKCPCAIEGDIGIRGNDASGDQSCIMAYTNFYTWAHHRDQGVLVYQRVSVQPVGSKLCTSDKGTGINADGKFFGDATTGNCMSRIRIRDN